MSESDDSLRAKVDQAMIYAPSAWLAYVTRIANAYATAYDYQKKVLTDIENQIRAERELGLLLLNMILPSIVGGAVGAIFAGKGRELVDGLAKSSSKFWATVGVDVGKTVLSDGYKTMVRTAINTYAAPAVGSWEPAGISAAAFTAGVLGAVFEHVTTVKDRLNRSKLKQIPNVSYRDYLNSIYYGPFIRLAPEMEELPSPFLLAKAMEIFLWSSWAWRSDTEYWLKRVLALTEKGWVETGFWENGMTKEVVMFVEVKHLDPILARLKLCGVAESWVTQSAVDIGGRRFLNILWVRQLDTKYRNTLLGNLLFQLKLSPNSASVDPFPAPRSMRLM